MSIRIALVGTPNSGKSALFNKITRSNQRVANYSGVTVESAEADFTFSDRRATLVDLPGAYSLRPYTDDEGVLLDLLKSHAFEAIVMVVDATQLERGVRFVMEVLKSFPLPTVIALNMIDLARAREFEINVQKLSELLGAPVVGTAAVKGEGVTELLLQLNEVLQNEQKCKDTKRVDTPKGEVADSNPDDVAAEILAFYKKADEIVKSSLKKPGKMDERSARIDRWVLHPFWGPLILLSVLGLTFQLMFNLAEIPMQAIQSAFSWASTQVLTLSFLSEGVKSFLVDGILAGVGGTLVFLPQILILFLLILFLEDFGFMARAVFLLDHWMGKVGLHGRAFLPLLSSFACAIPGIMATKTIESKKDRIATIMMIPLMTCSARIPVYTLLISSFIPNRNLILGVKVQGLVMLGLYVVGTGFGFLSGALLKRFFLKGATPPLLIELPSYKWPSLESLARGLVYRGKLFIHRVGTVILALTILIWFCVSFPKAPQGSQNPIESSFAAQMGHKIEPLLRPLGFDWRIGMAMVPAFAAREVMVSALTTAYAVQSAGSEEKESERLRLSEVIQKQWSVATGLSLMVWFIFAPQCLSTIATARRELQSWRWAAAMVFYLFVLAYSFSFLTYQIAVKWI